jgi:threonine synthase
MHYISTRNVQEKYDFRQVTLQGLAPDGGLFIPETWPEFDDLYNQAFSYRSLAAELFQPFVTPVIDSTSLSKLVDQAYQSFEHPDVVELKAYENHWVLELFHGPTLAFKDIAMQFLGRVMGSLLVDQPPITIVGATSGDTGGAAIAALSGLSHCQVFMLYPSGRVSLVQELQMTRGVGKNVFPIAIQGSFDDAQALVKRLFSDGDINQKLNLTTVNSINWCRIMAQMVYYFYAVNCFSRQNKSSSPVSFAVPTGNFGDVLAGFYAKLCGLPIEKLVVACNENDLLARTYQTGIYQPRHSRETLSPAMDIQVASNFERLLFELSDRDDQYVARKMQQLNEHGQFTMEKPILDKFRSLFEVYRVSDLQTMNKMQELSNKGYWVDPHTAVGLCAADQFSQKHPEFAASIITLATAHPVKFADTCFEITQKAPNWPESLKQLTHMRERVFRCSSRYSDIKSFILNRSLL